MASCHSVALLNDRLLGDPLETEMFRQTDWILDEDEERNAKGGEQFIASVYPKVLTKAVEYDEQYDAYQIRVIKRFEFSSELQRMSIIARNNLDKRCICYIKGSPEKLHELSDPESLPEEYFEVLEKYTNNGLRVIGLGYRYLDDFDYNEAKECKRDEVETDIQFLGFLIFANKLKAITAK